MAKLKQCGKKNCLKEMKKFCRYNSLNYFEKTKRYFSKYIIDRKELLPFNNLYNKCKIQMQICDEYIDDINSYLILLFEDNLKINKLILSGTDFSGKYFLLDENDILLDEEKLYQALKVYEKMVPKYNEKGNIKEAFIFAKIFTINYRLLGNINSDIYYYMGERIEFIIKEIDPKPKWYKEFKEIFQKIKLSPKIIKIQEKKIREEIKQKYKTKFEELDIKFKQRRNNREFIYFILQKYPYIGYEEDKKYRNFHDINEELLFYLRTKYIPDKYSFDIEDEDSQLKYYLIEYIYQLLNILYLT